MSYVDSDTSDDDIRVVVVGDHGVGKTTLVRNLCFGEKEYYSIQDTTTYGSSSYLKQPGRKETIGCEVNVKLRDHLEHPKKRYFVEFFDIGGGSQTYEKPRRVFYHRVEGVILVHDLTNRTSFENLGHWIRDLMKFSNDSPRDVNVFSLDGGEIEVKIEDDTSTWKVPILIVGTKLDLIANRKFISPDLTNQGLHLPKTITRNLDAYQQLQVSNFMFDSFRRDSAIWNHFETFYDRVYDYHHSRASSNVP